MFSLLGPGSGVGHNSVIFLLECQANYVADAIRKLAARAAVSHGPVAINLKAGRLEEYVKYVEKHMADKVRSCIYIR